MEQSDTYIGLKITDFTITDKFIRGSKSATFINRDNIEKVITISPEEIKKISYAYIGFKCHQDLLKVGDKIDDILKNIKFARITEIVKDGFNYLYVFIDLETGDVIHVIDTDHIKLY